MRPPQAGLRRVGQFFTAYSRGGLLRENIPDRTNRDLAVETTNCRGLEVAKAVVGDKIRGRSPPPAMSPSEERETEFGAMDERVFQDEFSTLLERISGLPARERALLVRMTDDHVTQQRDLEQALAGLEGSLDYLRLCMNYLVFDLEATRRENRCLRRLLAEAEDRPPVSDEDRESFWDDSTD